MLDRLFRISLATHYRMSEAGLIGPKDRIELLDGLLIKKPTRGPRYVFAAHTALDLLWGRLPDGFHARLNAPVELPGGRDGDSAPEPDVTEVRGAAIDYRDRHPGAADVLLVIEVVENSLVLDRSRLDRCGWFGIPTVWIINLRAGTVEVYTGPSGPIDDAGYANKTTRSIGESLELAFDEHRIEGIVVGDFFG